MEDVVLEECDLKCNLCEYPMTIFKRDGDVYFKCTQCEQSWILYKWYESGKDDPVIKTSCTILKSLWPSGMKEGSKMFREQYLSEWLKHKEFYAQAVFVAGFWNESQRDNYIKESHDAIDKWHLEHPMTIRPWWKFW